jgi:hypothetical protein
VSDTFWRTKPHSNPLPSESGREPGTRRRFVPGTFGYFRYFSHSRKVPTHWQLMFLMMRLFQHSLLFIFVNSPSHGSLLFRNRCNLNLLNCCAGQLVKTYKYCYNVSRIRQFKMQFKVAIAASVLLFFIAQTTGMPVATPGRGPHAYRDICTLPFMVLR